MYFASGTPRVATVADEDLEQLDVNATHFTQPDGTILAVRENWDASLFATLSIRAIYLWTSKPTVVISKVYRSVDDVDEYGENERLFWKLDSSMIGVITRRGFLLLYSLQVTDGARVFAPKFQQVHHFSVGPGEAAGLPLVELVFQARFLVESGGICSGLFVEDEVIVASRANGSIHTIHFDGDQIGAESVQLHQVDGLSDVGASVYVKEVVYSREFNAFFWLLSDGRLFAVKRHVDDDDLVPPPADGKAPEPVAPGNDSSPLEFRTDGDDHDDAASDVPSSEFDSEIDSNSVRGMPVDRAESVVDEFASESTPALSEWTSEASLPAADDPLPLTYRWSGQRVGDGPYVALAVNARFNLLSLGRTDGTYELHEWRKTAYFSGAAGDPWTRRVSHLADLVVHTGRNAISCMVWSWDGMALVIGYHSCGFVVVSTYGYPLLVATKKAVIAANPGETIHMDSYLFGVNSAFWGCGCFDLFVLPTNAMEDATSSVLHMLPFVRSAAANNQLADNFAHPLLIGSDACSLLAETSVEALDGPLRQKHIRFPNMYISENWPVTIAAIDGKGRSLVIGGRRGLALFSRELGRWKLFSNHQQEQSFVCRGVCFVGTHLVTLVQLVTSEFRLWMFNPGSSLDLNLICDQVELPMDSPSFLASVGPQVVVMSADGDVVEYWIDSTNEMFQVGRQWVLPETVDASNVMAVRRLGRVDGPLVMLSAGQLFVCDDTDVARIGPPTMTSLASYVEAIVAVNRVRGCPDPFVWTVSRDQCRVFVNGKQELVIPMDSVLLTVVGKYGIMIGVNEAITSRPSFDILTYEMTTKTSLFIHFVTEFLLHAHGLEAAQDFADQYLYLGYLNHALEMLLHRVWEREADTFAGFSDQALLPRVIQFLRHFDDYLDILVNCTRKTELSMWDYLFSIVGSPQALFEECLEANRLHTATAFLVILHNMESHSLSGKDSVRLLERVLQSENFELTRDLVRFLRSIAGKGASVRLWQNRNDAMYIHKSSSSHVSLSAMATGDQEDSCLYLEILISRHARKLLQNHRLKSLYTMTRTLDFPLGPWLTRERNRGAVLSNHLNALKALHRQFQWPYPTEFHIIPMPAATDVAPRVGSAPDPTPVTHASPLLRRHSISGLPDGPVAPAGSPALRAAALSPSPSRGRAGSPPLPTRRALRSTSRARSPPPPPSSSSLSGSPRTPSLRTRRSFSLVEAHVLQPAPPGSVAAVDHETVRALRRIMAEAQCFGWAMLLSAPLLDWRAVVEMVVRYGLGDEWARVRAALLAVESEGYRAMARAIEERVASG
ncbi:hypothetical protein AMAG_05365 [Allomyces macrogynus ATCC 38327]|uniref:RIC1 C-terminal alpha solenoid region domain-containing protein n=1 Tax=Allomyces macrogynus (strain ATCC 38327) TaxID=578462 RepID=A0A0L0SBQ3_ALLM3|nr:hypothetical protein AMAG_05365 [Allomyces macrogynus ATCC 38327]|eukprot:KNE59916.1 hypothetical protein AMAG_05365 [Allomyces macrogynus ATCC 38327]